MKAPGALIRILVTLAAEGDPDAFDAALESVASMDGSLEFVRTPVRQRVILGGVSERHLEMAIDLLQRRHRLQLQMGSPAIVYLETISRTIDHSYVHKRQSGGTGQFARVQMRFAPLPAGAGFQFRNAVADGSVPLQFVPGIEKGLEEARSRGPIVGYPITDLQATLLDGAFHEVDSSALAFQIAARVCFKEGVALAGPVLLEPVMKLELEVPAESGDPVVSDLQTRRAMTLRSLDRVGSKFITAFVPLSNLFGYENALRALTKDAGTIRMLFDHYGKIPPARPDPDDPHPGAAIGLRPA